MDHGVKITYSAGRGKNGKCFAYVRPNFPCLNRSVRVDCDSLDSYMKNIGSMLKFLVNGAVIGAESKEKALKEYYKVCDKADRGKCFEVQQIEE